jgi:hypothetical protein
VVIEPPIDVVMYQPQDSERIMSVLGVEAATAHEHPKAKEQVDSHPTEPATIVAALPIVDPLVGTSRVEPSVEDEGLLRDDHRLEPMVQEAVMEFDPRFQISKLSKS